MGREARCDCRWGARRGCVTALLESTELIVRGEIRARVPLRELERVRARDEWLEFTVAGEAVGLQLGAQLARRWAQAIVDGPPTLAHKLGISPESRLHVRGDLDDDALAAAVKSAASTQVAVHEADFAIVRTDDGAALNEWIADLSRETRSAPFWIVFVKGRNAPLGESAVRHVLRAHEFIDVKVASVSERLSALKFAQRRV